MVDRKDREDSRVIQQSTEINIPMVPLWGLLLALAKPLLLWYDSGSDVTQHSYIDLDQRDMEKYLKAPIDYGKAKNIYEHGGNSGGYAEITLTTALAAAHAKGVAVSQAGTPTKTGTIMAKCWGEVQKHKETKKVKIRFKDTSKKQHT